MVLNFIDGFDAKLKEYNETLEVQKGMGARGAAAPTKAAGRASFLKKFNPFKGKEMTFVHPSPAEQKPQVPIYKQYPKLIEELGALGRNADPAFDKKCPLSSDMSEQAFKDALQEVSSLYSVGSRGRKEVNEFIQKLSDLKHDIPRPRGKI